MDLCRLELVVDPDEYLMGVVTCNSGNTVGCRGGYKCTESYYIQVCIPEANDVADIHFTLGRESESAENADGSK